MMMFEIITLILMKQNRAKQNIEIVLFFQIQVVIIGFGYTAKLYKNKY